MRNCSPVSRYPTGSVGDFGLGNYGLVKLVPHRLQGDSKSWVTLAPLDGEFTDAPRVEVASCEDAANAAELSKQAERGRTCSIWSALSASLADESSAAPIACTMNERTSPETKILVSQLRRIKSNFSPSAIITMRPSSMYRLAAKSAGATRSRIVWMMNGACVHCPYLWVDVSHSLQGRCCVIAYSCEEDTVLAK